MFHRCTTTAIEKVGQLILQLSNYLAAVIDFSRLLCREKNPKAAADPDYYLRFVLHGEHRQNQKRLKLRAWVGLESEFIMMHGEFKKLSKSDYFRGL